MYKLPERPKINTQNLKSDGTLQDPDYEAAITYMRKLREISRRYPESLSVGKNPVRLTMNKFMETLPLRDQRSIYEQFHLTDLVRGGSFHTGRFP